MHGTLFFNNLNGGYLINQSCVGLRALEELEITRSEGLAKSIINHIKIQAHLRFELTLESNSTTSKQMSLMERSKLSVTIAKNESRVMTIQFESIVEAIEKQEMMINRICKAFEDTLNSEEDRYEKSLKDVLEQVHEQVPIFQRTELNVYKKGWKDLCHLMKEFESQSKYGISEKISSQELLDNMSELRQSNINLQSLFLLHLKQLEIIIDDYYINRRKILLEVGEAHKKHLQIQKINSEFFFVFFKEIKTTIFYSHRRILNSFKIEQFHHTLKNREQRKKKLKIVLAVGVAIVAAVISAKIFRRFQVC